MAEAGCETSVSMGLHFPREQLTRLNSYLCEAAITIDWVPGLSSQCSSPSKKSVQDNSQGQASEYFECTRKHYEHEYNITNDNHALKYSIITMLVTVIKPVMHATSYSHNT